MSQTPPAGGYVDHPMRTFRIILSSGRGDVEVNAHLVSAEGGALTFLTIAHGILYAIHGFCHGTWLSYEGSIPTAQEIDDLHALAQRTIDARAAFAGLVDNGKQQ